jgi:hypothetical protein
MGFQVKQVCQA